MAVGLLGGVGPVEGFAGDVDAVDAEADLGAVDEEGGAEDGSVGAVVDVYFPLKGMVSEVLWSEA